MLILLHSIQSYISSRLIFRYLPDIASAASDVAEFGLQQVLLINLWWCPGSSGSCWWSLVGILRWICLSAGRRSWVRCSSMGVDGCPVSQVRPAWILLGKKFTSIYCRYMASNLYPMNCNRFSVSHKCNQSCHYTIIYHGFKRPLINHAYPRAVFAWRVCVICKRRADSVSNNY